MFKLKIIRYYLQLLFRPRFRSREQLLRYQSRQLDRFARRVLTRSPFYRAFLEAGTALADLPVIGKAAFMANFDTINTAGLERDRCLERAVAAEQQKTFDSQIGEYTLGLSTGTSGNRGLFVASEAERARWAANIFYRVVKPRFRRQRVAFCLRANSKLYESVRSVAFSFRFYDIAEPLNPLAAALTEQQPHILCAQPSLLRELARRRRQGTLPVTPRQLISYAEVLDETDRSLIEGAFGVPITEIYQCTEGFLGHTCAHGTMHLNEDLVHFRRERIDDRRFYPILTDFTRTTQPVVNYRMNDILVLRDTPCPCGSPLTALAGIEGRSDEVLSLDGQSIFPDLMRRRVVLATNRIDDYAIHQTGPNRLDIFLESPVYAHAVEAVRRTFERWFAERGITGVELCFYPTLPVHVAGTKRRRVRRLL